MRRGRDVLCIVKFSWLGKKKSTRARARARSDRSVDLYKSNDYGDMKAIVQISDSGNVI